MSAEKVLAAAVAKSEELGVKVFYRLKITTNRYFCFVFTTLRLYIWIQYIHFIKRYFTLRRTVSRFFLWYYDVCR